MSHPTQQAFVEIVAEINQQLVRGGSVLEIGSYDVNGSIRRIFGEADRYVGVDLVEGPGVDLVSFGHELELPPASFDVTLSCECFEHDPHWESTLRRMIELTRPGGLVLFTCASWARPEHGTRRMGTSLSPGTQEEGLDYYRNLTVSDLLRALDLQEYFNSWGYGYQPDFQDLYFAGVRKGEVPEGEAVARIPGREQVAHVSRLVTQRKRSSGRRRRFVRSFVSESTYQDLTYLTFHASRPYVKFILPDSGYQILKKWARR